MEQSPVSLASEYINLGVEYYENGQLENAIVAFADALATSKQIVNYEDEDTPMYDPQGPFEPRFGRSQKFMPATSDLFIFLNPIKVPERLPTMKIDKTLSLITIFNLAICNHRSAIMNNMNKKSLRKALQLYELAYAIQMQEGIDMTLTPTMIIMSNVGHIHKILGNKDNAMQCFQHLLSTLMFLVEAGERDMVWEFDGFFQNILKTIYSDSPAAAA
jgi:tetratricopeptide (TPR) repeat protein